LCQIVYKVYSKKSIYSVNESIWLKLSILKCFKILYYKVDDKNYCNNSMVICNKDDKEN